MNKSLLFRFMLITFLLWAAGCAQKPETEIAAARQAVQTAEAAEAPTYAASEFQTAKDTLASAEAETAVQSVEELLSKAPKAKGTRADLEALQGDLAAVKAACADASKAFADGQYMAAKDQFNNVLSKAAAIRSEVESAIAKKGR